MVRPVFEDVTVAAGRIAGTVSRTPVVPSFGLSRVFGADVRLKLETTQPTRAFKVRGAANVILADVDLSSRPGVVSYSTGNHGRAVTWVAGRSGVRSIVCMSTNTTHDKQAALRAMGAELRVDGTSQDDAGVAAQALADEGYLLVDPINDPLTTAGQGTIGLEIVQDWPDVDTVVVPVSGGALAAGIALAVKSMRPGARVVGVSMEGGAAMAASLAAGRPVAVPEVESLADSLQGGITPQNDHSREMVDELVDDLVLVSEDQIATAMAEAVIEERLVLEGAGATPIAALISCDRSLFGDRIALVATGAMVSAGVIVDVVAARRTAVEALLGKP